MRALYLIKPDLKARQERKIFDLAKDYMKDYTLYLACSVEEVRKDLHYDLVITAFYPFLGDILSVINKPRHIHFTSSGLDMLEKLDYDISGIRITASKGVNSKSISEYVFAYILALTKNVFHSYENQKEKKWDRAWSTELTGKTLGIIGYGKIGKQVAALAHTFGMNVMVSAYESLLENINDANICKVENVFQESHFIVICVPLTQETKGFVNSRLLDYLSEHSVLINVSRGGVIDERDLCSFLEANRNNYAVLDVFETEPLQEHSSLWELDNVYVTPHIAGTTDLYLENMFEILSTKV